MGDSSASVSPGAAPSPARKPPPLDLYELRAGPLVPAPIPSVGTTVSVESAASVAAAARALPAPAVAAAAVSAEELELALDDASYDSSSESDAETGGKDKEKVEKKKREVVIEFFNVHKTYLLGVEGIPALRGVSLRVRRGEFLVILGTSGSGKTTLLNLIGTIDRPTKGALVLFGKRIEYDTKDLSLAKIRLNKIGFVFQTFNLISSMTAMENVEMPAILRGRLTRPERRKRARALLEGVGMSGRLKHLPSQMSGGEQQRVTIARAMMNKPDLLVVDEPTGDLDTINTAIVMKLLRDLNANEGVTIVMVTHDATLSTFGHRVAFMRDGKMVSLEKVPRARRLLTHQKLDEDLMNVNVEGPGSTPRDAYARTELRTVRDYACCTFFEDQSRAMLARDTAGRVSTDERLPEPLTGKASDEGKASPIDSESEGEDSDEREDSAEGDP